MVQYNPEFTQTIYLDTESYVPPNDRGKVTGSSLIVNPTNPSHFLLGGVFRRDFPLKTNSSSTKEFWGFSQDQEKETLTAIYNFFRESWNAIELRSRKDHSDLITVGIGIARTDLPILFVRSKLHNIANEEMLYETFLKTKVVDLSDTAIPFFNRNPDPVLYPKPANAMSSRFGIGNRKPTGKNVWVMCDNRDYKGIKERTSEEVKTAVHLTEKMLSEIRRMGQR